MVARDQARLQCNVRRLARERDAVILAHNYQAGEVQDVADFVGDSLGLAIEASRTEASTIVVCGVYFMAETAKILNPDRRVIIPDATAGCSLADSITLAELRAWKARHPGAVVVSYVNTTAAIKAESDYCVTSGNAEAVIRAIPEDTEILFSPDLFLGSWLKERLGRKQMHVWTGECHVHAAIRPEEIEARVAAESNAELLIHPECGCTSRYVWAQANGMLSATPTHVLSTEGIVRHAKECSAEAVVVATETGILHRLRKEVPGKRFLAADDGAVCRFMKQVSLENLHDALCDLSPQIDVPADVAAKARVAIERMLSVTPREGSSTS